MAETYHVGRDSAAFKRWLTNAKENWLLILDNADDPSLNLDKVFPSGSRGTIIVTTRNPHCRIHSTVGSREISQMDREEAAVLLLRASGIQHVNDRSKSTARPVVDMLGCLALAVSHAGALVLNGICSLDEYCSMYNQSGDKILSRLPPQSPGDYNHTVYATLDISARSIERLSSEMGANALDLLNVFGFFHFDNISEDIFESAWKMIPESDDCPWWVANQITMIRENRSQSWDPIPFREAVNLLASFSLIYISGTNQRISLHPLVHSWARESLRKEVQDWRMSSISTLSMAVPYKYESQAYPIAVQLISHMSACLAYAPLETLLEIDTQATDRIRITHSIVVLHSYGALSLNIQQYLGYAKLAFEYANRIWGIENYWTCFVAADLALALMNISKYQSAQALLEKLVPISVKVNGVDEAQTLKSMKLLAQVYNRVKQHEKAMELSKKVLVYVETLRVPRGYKVRAIEELAEAYAGLNQIEDAIQVQEESLKIESDSENENPFGLLHARSRLARFYQKAGRLQEARDLKLTVLRTSTELFGEEHPDSVMYMFDLAVSYWRLGQLDDAISLIAKAVDIAERLNHHELKYYKQVLEELKLKREKSQSELHQKHFEIQEGSSKKAKNPMRKSKVGAWLRKPRHTLDLKEEGQVEKKPNVP